VPLNFPPEAGALVQIVAGSDHACALAADGAIWCWGAGDRGQLGDGGTSGHFVPARVHLTCP
jgi:alpha-tubulin suppressor-like RCC1 family protein